MASDASPLAMDLLEDGRDSTRVVLGALVEKNPRSPTELAKDTGLHRVTVSQAVDILTFAGLAEEVDHDADGRKTYYEPTEYAREKLQEDSDVE